MTDPERMMRILKYAFIVSVLLFVSVSIEVPSKAVHPPQRLFELIIVLLALVNVFLGFVGWPFLSRLAKANAVHARNTTALNRWASGNIASLAMIESCALFAVVLHTLGSATKLVGFLFGVAFLALLFWSPTSPPASENVDGSSVDRA